MAHSKHNLSQKPRETPPLPCPWWVTDTVSLTKLKKEINTETSKHKKESEGQSKTHGGPLGTNERSVPKHPQRCQPEMQRETAHDRQSPRGLPRLREMEKVRPARCSQRPKEAETQKKH